MYQMPRLEDKLPWLVKAEVFSTLDSKGVNQIGLNEESSMETIFWTPGTWECHLEQAWRQTNWLQAPWVVWQEEMIRPWQRPDQAFQRATETNLKLNKSKLKLRQPEVKFVGRAIHQPRFKTESRKRESCGGNVWMNWWPLWASFKCLLKFLPRLTEVTQPLPELSAKEAQPF